MDDQPTLVHATAIAVEGAGAILLLGPSGCGKSDLALRALSQPIEIAGQRHHVQLIADDQVHVTRRGDRLFAAAPPTIAGLMEVRGLGIVKFQHLEEAPIVLAVSLVDGAAVERVPDRQSAWTLSGHPVPLVHLAPFEASAPVKLVLAACQAAAAITAPARDENRG